jgi:DNA repair exonuclease SbcCD ATPase subunit
MTRSALNFGGVRSFAVAAIALLLAAMPAAAQAPRNAPPDAVTPVEEFAQQVEQLKKTFSDVGKKIEESATAIDSVTDVEKARKEIEQLRAIVGGLLGAVSDNGAVPQLGLKALAHARTKLKALEQDTRFTREEQKFLLGEWQKLVEETERATDELGRARQEFSGLLRVLQTREDFIDELLQIRRAGEAITVIRKLTKEIRDASDSLKKLIGSIKPPGV